MISLAAEPQVDVDVLLSLSLSLFTDELRELACQSLWYLKLLWFCKADLVDNDIFYHLVISGHQTISKFF